MKIIKISAIIVLCLLLFAGCASTDKGSATDIADHIKELSPANVTWAEIDRSKISTYFGISDSDVTDFKGYINSSEVHFDIVAVFEFEGQDERDAIINGTKTLAEQMSGNYSLVNADEAKKIDNMLLFETDKFIIFSVTDSSSQTLEYLTETLKATKIA